MGTNGFDLSECLSQAQAGDQQAAKALVHHLYPVVIRIVRAHRPVRQAEEDLMQDIFLKMFAKLGQYTPRPGIPFTHWISRLAVRTCLDALRAEKRRPELRWADLSEPESAWITYFLSEQSDEPPAAQGDTWDLVNSLLGQLSPKDRLVITLADLENQSVADISQKTGWKQATVKVRTFRARQRLRRMAARLKKENYL